MTLKWTTDAPAVAGWYCWKHAPDNPYATPGEKFRVGEYHEDGTWTGADGTHWAMKTPVHGMGYWDPDTCVWAGPIRPRRTTMPDDLWKPPGTVPLVGGPPPVPDLTSDDGVKLWSSFRNRVDMTPGERLASEFAHQLDACREALRAAEFVLGHFVDKHGGCRCGSQFSARAPLASTRACLPEHTDAYEREVLRQDAERNDAKEADWARKLLLRALGADDND